MTADLAYERQQRLTNLRSNVLYAMIQAEKLLGEGHDIAKALAKVKADIDAYKIQIEPKEKAKRG